MIREAVRNMGRILAVAFRPARDEQPPSKNLKQALSSLDQVTHEIKTGSSQSTNSEVLMQMLERIK